MFGTIRKHSQALWIPIIIVIVISFVVYFTPGFDPLDQRSTGLTQDEAQLEQAKRHVLFGQALMLFQQFRGFLPPSYNKDSAASQMRPHNLMGDDPQDQQQFGEMDDYPGLDYRARLRLLRLQKAAELGLIVGRETAVARVESMFSTDDTPFSQAAYEAFLKPFQDRGFLDTGESGKTQFREFVREEIILGHPVITQGEMGLLDLLMTRASGLFPDHTVAARLNEQNKKFTAQAVFFPADTIRTNVTQAADANGTLLTAHYQTIPNRFFIQPKMRIGYVKVGNQFYQARAEKNYKNDQGQTFANLVTNRITLHHNSDTNSSDIFEDANGTKLPAGPALTAAAEERVRFLHQTELNNLTQGPTQKEAQAFETLLFDQAPEENWTLTRLRQQSLLWGDGQTKQPLTYLEVDISPRDPDPPLPVSVLQRAAQSLREVPQGTLDEQPIEVTGDGYYIIGFVKNIPGRTRAYSELTEKQLAEVRQDYINTELAKRIRNEGADYKQAVDELMKKGTSFAQIAQDTNGTHPTVALPAMKLNDTNSTAELDGLALLSQILAAIPRGPGATVDAGWTSDFTSADNTRSAGFIVHVSKVEAGAPSTPAQLQAFADYHREGARNLSARSGPVPPWLSQEAKVLDAELAVVIFLEKLTRLQPDHDETHQYYLERAADIKAIKAGNKAMPGDMTMEGLEKDQQDALAKMAALRIHNDHLLDFLEAAHQKYFKLTNNDQYAEQKNEALRKAKAFQAKHPPAGK